MDDLKFKCYRCHQDSPFTITVENRDEVARFASEGTSLGKVNFICTRCGYANLIEISIEAASEILSRLSSEDPEIRDAVDRARKGDYSKASDIASKFGFKF